MTFQQARAYLNSFINYERINDYSYKKEFKLERTAAFLESIGNPQKELKVIHVAGTKGKGSTCAFVAYILKQAGFKTGLYTSPHLNNFRERIRILAASNKQQAAGLEFEGMISEEDVCRYIERLKPAIESFTPLESPAIHSGVDSKNLVVSRNEMANSAGQRDKFERGLKPRSNFLTEFTKESQWGKLSFFEVYTALAFLYFNENKVDFAVLETGLGGRLDATNTANPFVCAITPISYEHTNQLGSTLKQIAREKAGIIRHRHQLVVVAPQEREAFLEIKSRCAKLKARCLFVGEDITYEELSSNNEHQVFNCTSRLEKYQNLKINLLGYHQLINASLSIGIIEALKAFDINIKQEAIREGLGNAFWPGRFEIIKKNPFIILDGAQNKASAGALKDTLIKMFGKKDIILVLGVSSDKDIKGIATVLEPISKTVILTQADNPRAMPVETMARHFKKDTLRKSKSVAETMRLAKDLASDEDVIVVTGSLFVVGEARGICLN